METITLALKQEDGQTMFTPPLVLSFLSEKFKVYKSTFDNHAMTVENIETKKVAMVGVAEVIYGDVYLETLKFSHTILQKIQGE